MEQVPAEIEQALTSLDETAKRILSLANEMMGAHDGDLYGMDLFALGVLNRSKALVSGFSQLVRTRNLLCAGALLRLQLDTALRFTAAWLVESPHEFAMAVLDGAKIRNMQDETGKRMTDAYLVSRLAEEFDWVPRVYERTSEYVHLSSVHVLAAITLDKDSGTDGGFRLKVSSEDKPLPITLYVEAVEAFKACVEIVLKYAHGWVFTKANPEKVAEMKEARLRRKE